MLAPAILLAGCLAWGVTFSYCPVFHVIAGALLIIAVGVQAREQVRVFETRRGRR